jgi:hypothetical protein
MGNPECCNSHASLLQNILTAAKSR